LQGQTRKSRRGEKIRRKRKTNQRQTEKNFTTCIAQGGRPRCDESKNIKKCCFWHHKLPHMLLKYRGAAYSLMCSTKAPITFFFFFIFIKIQNCPQNQ